MSEDQTQVSAFIARETKDLLDEYVRATGAKKGRVIEEALDFFLAAQSGIPAEYIVPKTIVLTGESFDRLVYRIENPGEPTPALRALMRGR
ncbi:MAG TPA: hypothetical protein VIL41_02995 [Coriobacteriia bacterium]